MLETDKQSTEVLAILINAVVFGFDVFLLKKSDNGLFQLPTAFAGNNLYKRDAVFYCFINHTVELGIYFLAFVEYLV